MNSDDHIRATVIRHRRDPARRVPAQLLLARTWRERGDFRRAGLLLGLTLATAERHHGPGSLAVAAVCNEWGVLGKYDGRFDRSAVLYRRALAIYRRHFGEHHDTVATICHNLGGLEHARGRPYEGEAWAARSVAIRTALHGAESPLVAADLAAWAALLDGCGRLDDAERHLRTAVAILSGAAGGDVDPAHIMEVAAAMHNLAAVQHRRARLQDALLGYRRALALKEQHRGRGHPELATTLVGLATLHRQLGEPHSAEQLYGRAIRLLTGQVAADHPVLTAALRGRAAVQRTDAPVSRGPAVRQAVMDG